MKQRGSKPDILALSSTEKEGEFGGDGEGSGEEWRWEPSVGVGEGIYCTDCDNRGLTDGIFWEA